MAAQNDVPLLRRREGMPGWVAGLLILLMIGSWIYVLNCLLSAVLLTQSFFLGSPLIRMSVAPLGDAALPGDGYWSQVLVDAGGVSWPPRVVLILAGFVTLAAQATIAVLIALFTRQMLRGAPFASRLSRAFVTAGAVIGLGALISQILTLAGHSGVRAELSQEWQTLLATAPNDTIDPIPVLLGLALVALGIAFRAGERLQRDTEGLI
jgi:hypothetical protein